MTAPMPQIVRLLAVTLDEHVIGALDDPYTRYATKAMSKVLQYVERWVDLGAAAQQADLADLGETLTVVLTSLESLAPAAAWAVPATEHAVAARGSCEGVGRGGTGTALAEARRRLDMLVMLLAGQDDDDARYLRRLIRPYLARHVAREAEIAAPTFIQFAPRR